VCCCCDALVWGAARKREGGRRRAAAADGSGTAAAAASPPALALACRIGVAPVFCFACVLLGQRDRPGRSTISRAPLVRRDPEGRRRIGRSIDRGAAESAERERRLQRRVVSLTLALSLSVPRPHTTERARGRDRLNRGDRVVSSVLVAPRRERARERARDGRQSDEESFRLGPSPALSLSVCLQRQQKKNK
jgi:hypothetical protein